MLYWQKISIEQNGAGQPEMMIVALFMKRLYFS